MTRRRRGAALAAVGLAAAALCVAPAAGADGVRSVKVSGTLTFSPPSHFSGKVNSPKFDACALTSSVAIRRYDNAMDTTFEVVGKGRTNRKGRYSVEVPNAQAGQFQLYVMPHKFNETEGVVKCQAFVGARVQF